MTVVAFEGVSRWYQGGVRALAKVSLTVEEGRVYGLLGRNGAGKTTLLRMIPPLLHPSAGSVRVFGKDPWEHEEIRVHIGYMAEDDERPGYLRPRDYFELCAELYPTWDDGMLWHYLDRLGLDPNRRFSQMSKGEKRQASLLCAVCHKPRLLVLDEPASGLDPAVRREFLEIVTELVAEGNSTVLFSSHIVPDVERVATDIVILHHGSILLHKSTDDLHEEIRLVELPAAEVDVTQLSRMRGVLSLKESGEHVQALVSCGRDGPDDWLRQYVPTRAVAQGVPSRSLPLEDLFIRLTGGNG
ncbi:MAG: ABC transporter ATP-binding protein [Thermodesulfobacteriota bacterium]